MNKLFTKVAALTLGVAMAAGVGVALGSAKASEAKAADVTDTLTADKLAATATTYTAFSNVSDTSSAVYAGNSAKSANGGIQLRSKNSNSGIVTTASGGNLKSISITVESGSNTLDVYGKTSPYTAASDLYNSGTQGTKIGSASETGSITLTNPGNYTYVGLRSNNGALYLTNITIVWEASQEGPTALDTPTLTKTDTKLSWTTVTNAASYELTVDGAVVYSGSDTTFSLSASQMEHGKHSASIVAKPASTDTEHKDSLAGETSWVAFDHEGTADDPYTVADAILAIDEGVTGTKYVTGTVSSIVTPYSSQYSNITFNFVDNVTDTAFMQAYRCGGTEAANVAVGDTVVVSGSLKKHSSTYELDSGCQIVSRVTPQVDTKYTVTFNSNGGTDPAAKEVGEGLVFTFPSAGTKDGYVFKGWTNDSGTSYYQENDTSAPVNAATTYNGEWQTKGLESDPYNVAGARAAVAANAGIRGVYTTGIVKEIVTPYDSQYKNITFNIVDAAGDTDYLQVFRCTGDDASKVAVGDIVVVSGNLKLHNSIPEYEAGCVLKSLVTPVTTYDITYVKGEGTGNDYIVPDVEAGSSHTLVTFETAGFTAPDGKKFKGWRVGDDTELRAPGYVLENVAGDVTITAIYEADWTAAQKTQLETALHGYLPPFFGELAADLITTENSARFIVSGDLSEEFATKLGDGWVLGSDGNYMKLGDNYYLTASINVEGVKAVGDYYSDIEFIYHEGQPIQEFTVTYLPGNGTGESIEIDVEEGSSHTLRSLDETSFVAPAGQQFKGWQVDNDTELHAPGYVLENVASNVTVTAIYEDIPATDWSDAFKAAYTSRFGSADLPPFVDAALAGDENTMYWEADEESGNPIPFGYVVAEGDLMQKALTAFVNAWSFAGDVDTGVYIFRDKDMNAFVHIMYYDGYTVLLFTTIGNVALDTNGVKNKYFVGDAIDTTNLEVHPVLMDGAVVPGLYLPSTLWTVSPSTFTEAGTQDVTVTVTGFFTTPVELTYSVDVTAVVAESISVSGQAAKTSYSVGEEWSAEGLVVTVHYNNGTEADVTDQVTWSFDPAETAAEVTSVSAVAHLGDLSSDAFAFDVVVEQSYDADAFAKDLLDMVAPICANYDGKKNNKAALKTVWDTMSQRYSTLSNEEKAKVIAAAAKADGTDLEKAMAFYNYACKKYGLTKFIEGRAVKALVTEHETGNSILPIVVIVASSVAAITAIGVVIVLKRRKALLAK